MASIVSNLYVWRVGRRSTRPQAPRRVEVSIEEAARLAPEWGRVEARHAAGPQDSAAARWPLGSF